MTQYIQLDQKEHYSILRFKDLKNIDANTAHRVKAEVKGLLDDKTSNIIVDLHNVHFIDSTGFGALISLLKTVKSRGGRLILSSVSNEVQELMDLMQLLNVFELKNSIEDAENSLTH